MTIKNRYFFVAATLFIFHAFVLAADGKDDRQKWSLSINVSETAGFQVAKAILGWRGTLIPIHLDGSYMMSRQWGLGFGMVYRYEDYGMNISNVEFGKADFLELWTNYHELFLMAGPRYSFFNQGNEGLFAAFKLGLGGAISPGGFAFSAVGQPEIGYGFVFGEQLAFFMDFAVGVLFNLPIIERPRLGFHGLTPIGWLVHRTTPIARISLGIAF